MIDCHLVEIPISLSALHAWAEHRKLSAGPQLDEGLALHHLLGETFGPGILQPFRIFSVRGGRHGTIMAYSAEDGATLAETARMAAEPSAAEVLELQSLRSLPRPAATWKIGQRLGFDLRTRPVVRLASILEGPDGSFPKGSEIDAFLAQALRGDIPTRNRETVYLDWLRARIAGAADLDLSGTHLVRFKRTRVQRNGRLLEGPDAVFHGTLVISDAAAFSEVLAAGVGRHRSYGYGMLLLRPPQRRRSC